MVSTTPKTRLSKKPSQYPSLAFHLLRLSQLLSSIIVSSVLEFFVHHLNVEHYSIPWTFILLLSFSLLTITILIITTFFHFTRTLTPKHNLTINAILTVLWILGLSLLCWNLGWTLGHRCTPTTWHNDAGIMVCRLYKALTAFTVTGLLSTFLALLLDFHVQRKTTVLGRYNHMLDIKAPTDLRSSSPFHPINEGGEAPYGQRRDPSHDLTRPYKVQKPIEAQQFGYSAPSEQTSYGGGGGDGPAWL